MFNIILLRFSVILASNKHAMSLTCLDDSGPRFAPLPGETVGLLVLDQSLLGDMEGRVGPKAAAAFVNGSQSFRWIYIQAKEDPDAEEMSFGVGKEGEVQKRFKCVLLATRDRLKAQGFTKSFHLARMQINAGDGSAKEESFVATSIQRLDDSKEYSWKPDDVIREVKSRAGKHFVALQADIKKSIEVARESVANGRQPTGPEESYMTLTLRWIAKEERLRVQVDFRTANGIYVVGQGVEGPKAAPSRTGTQFGVIGGIVFEVAKEGRIEQMNTMKLTPFTKELAPPPASTRPLP